MKMLNNSLEIIDVPSESMPGYTFPDDDLEFLAVAEGFASLEWTRVCKLVNLDPNVGAVAENYHGVLQSQGRWNFDYPEPKDFIRSGA